MPCACRDEEFALANWPQDRQYGLRFNERLNAWFFLLARQPMNTWTTRFVWLLVLSGVPIMIWAEVSIAENTYRFWKHGVAKQALVVALDQNVFVPRGGTMFYYRIQIDGRETTAIFRLRLPEGKFVPVLVLPDNPSEIALGRKDSSLFEIFEYSIGGKVYAVLSLISAIFFTCFLPSFLWNIWSKRRKLFNY